MNKSIDLICLDMDGVLADFWSAACRVHGYDPDAVSADHRAMYDMWSWMNIDRSDFYAPMKEHDFWAGLEPYPWAEELWISCIGKANRLIIATSPAGGGGCHTGKLEWLKKHLGLGWGWAVIGSHKHLMAAPRRVLIDDSPGQCHRWRLFGGYAIDFKQPWDPSSRGYESHQVGLELNDFSRQLEEL